MKKLFWLILCSVVIILCGCREAFYYNYDQLKNDITEVEIIEITTDNSGRHEKILKTLTNDETLELFLVLSDIKFSYPFGDPPGVYGICIKLYYKNGELEIIGQMGTIRYDKDKEPYAWYKRRCTLEEFNTLISKFIDVL